VFGFIAELWRRLRTPSIKSVAERVDAIVEQRRTKTRYALGGANPVRTYTSISGLRASASRTLSKTARP
jgi:hypothetical protein